MQLQFTVENLEYFLFIVTRVSAFVFTAPFFSFGSIPRQFKIAFTLIFSTLLYLTLPSVPVTYPGVIGFSLMVMSEALAGALLGYFTNIVMTILNFTGRLIDMEIGFAMVTMYDPVFKVDTSVTGNLYNYFVIILLLVNDFHHYFLKAFVDAFKVVPIGRAVISANTVNVITYFLGNYFMIAMRLMLPIYATMLLVNVVLGVMAKVAPQMNMFVVGIQLKLLGGLVVMVLMMTMLPGVADYLTKKGLPFREAYKITGSIVKYAIDKKKTLNELSLDEYTTFSDIFTNDIYDAINIHNCVESRNIYGGPSKEAVSLQIKETLEEISKY